MCFSLHVFAARASGLTFVCVSDAQPTEGEREVWNQVNSVLQESESILAGLQAYKGAGQEIRDVRKHFKCIVSIWEEKGNGLYMSHHPSKFS